VTALPAVFVIDDSMGFIASVALLLGIVPKGTPPLAYITSRIDDGPAGCVVSARETGGRAAARILAVRSLLVSAR